MKLAAGYIVFDGLETLEHSIKSIRNCVDLVIVSYQTISWGNTQCSPNLISELNRLQQIGLVNHIIEFKDFRPSSLIHPNEVLMAKSYETLKRQSTLELALSLGATHYLSMDADEFYLESEFNKAKTFIMNNDIDASAVHYINYVTPTLSQGYSKFNVPFIYKINKNSRHHSQQGIFSNIDPTRGLFDESYSKIKVFDKSEISMHHMEMYRSDLMLKYQSSSRYFRDRSLLPTLINDINLSKSTKELEYTAIHFGDTISQLHSKFSLIECENLFNLPTNCNCL